MELPEKAIFCLSDAPLRLHEVLVKHPWDVFFQHSLHILVKNEMFWVVFELGVCSSLRAGEEVYYVENVSFCPLPSSDTQIPGLSGTLSIFTHNSFTYLFMGFLLGPILHSVAHPVAWEQRQP